jgi:hypothetical protein
MLKIFSFALWFFSMSVTQAQPYIDIASLNYVHSPDAGIWRRNNDHNHFDFFSAAFNLPFVLKKDSSIFLVSPFIERWNISFTKAIGNYTDLPSHLNSIVLPATFIKQLSANWHLTASVIPRWNGGTDAVFKNSFQLGGAILASYRKSSALVFKLGLYYNSELSGAFFMPLLGIDWEINSRNNIFGVLPGKLVFEHKAAAHFYWGFNFKAITNTYDAGFIIYNTNNGAAANDKYLRIDDNQLGLYADYYLCKHLVLNFELGHSVLRKMRIGLKNPALKYFYTNKTNDDLLLKLSLNYRIRFKNG